MGGGLLLPDTHIGHEDPGEVNQCSVCGSAEDRSSQRTPERLSPKAAPLHPDLPGGHGLQGGKEVANQTARFSDSPFIRDAIAFCEIQGTFLRLRLKSQPSWLLFLLLSRLPSSLGEKTATRSFHGPQTTFRSRSITHTHIKRISADTPKADAPAEREEWRLAPSVDVTTHTDLGAGMG